MRLKPSKKKNFIATVLGVDMFKLYALVAENEIEKKVIRGNLFVRKVIVPENEERQPLEDICTNYV